MCLSVWWLVCLLSISVQRFIFNQPLYWGKWQMWTLNVGEALCFPKIEIWAFICHFPPYKGWLKTNRLFTRNNSLFISVISQDDHPTSNLLYESVHFLELVGVHLTITVPAMSKRLLDLYDRILGNLKSRLRLLVSFDRDHWSSKMGL